MKSKFIPKSRITNKVSTVYNNAKEEMWYSFSTPDNSKEKEETRLWREAQIAEKSRIESIPLEQLSFRDLYKFPFHQAKYGSWVYDTNSNFIFQFEFNNEETREKIIQILNGELLEYKKNKTESKGGQIFINDQLAITIRGWGSLTGVGAYNLDGKFAAKIQDSLANYIVGELSN